MYYFETDKSGDRRAISPVIESFLRKRIYLSVIFLPMPDNNKIIYTYTYRGLARSFAFIGVIQRKKGSLYGNNKAHNGCVLLTS